MFLLNNNNSSETPWIGTVIIPCRHGTNEEFRRVLKQHRIKVYYKTTNNLRNTLVLLKEKIPFMSAQICVYKLGCVECDASCIAELSREIFTRLKKHHMYTKKLSNNPVELERLPIKSAMAVQQLSNRY
ncbi:unnamed protein product [Schistosoma curassoni]|uniref:Uncharacterized protein n=1 Tax=Schistosoma curassoni TaxID=6186 RepID=A0A183JRU9_9TREM|nr:unnamed protein product [Schistosoma curassoni]